MRAIYIRRINKEDENYIILVPIDASTEHLKEKLSHTVDLENVFSIGIVDYDHKFYSIAGAQEAYSKITLESCPGFEMCYDHSDMNAGLIAVSEMFQSNKRLKYIRTIGFNKNSTNLMFIFSDDLPHHKLATFFTGGLVNRCLSAGFVKVEDEQFVVLPHRSESLNIGPALGDMEQDGRRYTFESDHNDQALINQLYGTFKDGMLPTTPTSDQGQPASYIKFMITDPGDEEEDFVRSSLSILSGGLGDLSMAMRNMVNKFSSVDENDWIYDQVILNEHPVYLIALNDESTVQSSHRLTVNEDEDLDRIWGNFFDRPQEANDEDTSSSVFFFDTDNCCIWANSKSDIRLLRRFIQTPDLVI